MIPVPIARGARATGRRPCARLGAVPRLRYAFVVVFAVSAAYHAVALARPGFGEPSPAWRHALFVAVNLAFAAGFARPPRWFVLPVALLAVQQLASHGAYALGVWHAERRVDWASVGVLVA